MFELCYHRLKNIDKRFLKKITEDVRAEKQNMGWLHFIMSPSCLCQRGPDNDQLGL